MLSLEEYFGAVCPIQRVSLQQVAGILMEEVMLSKGFLRLDV
jgi:hypothetical protein